MLQANRTAQVTPNLKIDSGQVDGLGRPRCRTVIDELAEAYIDLNADGGATKDRLLERGFSSLELDMYGAQARTIAAKSFVRIVERPHYDRPARVSAAAAEIVRIMPTMQEICMHLQNRKYEKPELDDILAEAIAMSADQFAHIGGAS